MSKRYVFERATLIRAPLDRVFEFFSAPENLARITPPSLGFRIIDAPWRPIEQGDRISYTIRVAGVALEWLTHISRWDPPKSFVDEQERGPYRQWVHTHTFTPTAEGVRMHDHVVYELPFGILGRTFGGWLVRRQVRAIFDYRAEAIEAIFPSGERINDRVGGASDQPPIP